MGTVRPVCTTSTYPKDILCNLQLSFVDCNDFVVALRRRGPSSV